MDWHVVGMCLLIIVARTIDVSMGTLRTVAVINGRKYLALSLGFFEVLVWVFAVSAVVGEGLEKPWYAVAYALGFAIGNFVGISIEQSLALGAQVVRIFSRKGHEIATALRAKNLPVTEFEGKGRDGAVSLVFVQCKRRQAGKVIADAQQIDPESFILYDDTKFVRHGIGLQRPGGWRSILIRK